MHLRKICEEYYPLVLGYLMTLTCGDKDLSEDLTQETFLRAIQHINSFRGEAKMSTWLCQIAKYTFWQHLSKKSRFSEVSIESVSELPTSTLIDEMYLEKETHSKLYQKIREMEPMMRDVMLYRITGELSFKEIGQIMDKTENWARVTFYRGKQQLGKEMRKDDEV